ncbi:MAG: choice-of-anchor J domain-containing protein [Bacteroidales bacterium]|nr:choice-of-anchor J domain-containing protein [Bacteroidales bacterium]
MAKTLQILFLGLAIVLSGSTMAQNKKLQRDASMERAAMTKKGVKKMKRHKKAPLFTKTTSIFSEDFTNAPDTAWRYYDNDGDGYTWEYDSYYENMVSYSYDDYNYEALYPDNWLITPQITIPANGAVLSYGYFAYDEDYYSEVYSVMVSPSGSDNIDSFYVPIVSDDMLTSDAYMTNTLSLNLFAGQTVRLAFVHHNCYDEWGLGLDDIEVYSLDSVDLAVTGTNVRPVSQSNASATITADVENLGFAAINNLTVYCDINGTVTNATIASLPSMQTATASFTGINLSNLGSYNMKFYVADPDDADNTNDTLSVTTTVLPAYSLTWDFEGDTNLPAAFTTGRYDNGTAYSEGFFPNNEAWVVFDDTEYDYLEPGFEGGVRVAMAESWFDENDNGLYKTAYPANRWLITPSIRLTTGNYFVWDAYSMDSEYLEDYKVRISTTNTDTASFTTLATIIEEEDTWQRRLVDLSAYAGQDVYIAIQYISDDMFRLLVDNLKIAGLATPTPDGPEPEGLETADGSDINVYPNPTTGVITVAAANIIRIEVIDAMGRVAMTQNGSANTMNISALAEGVYTLRVATENGVSMKRIVKK